MPLEGDAQSERSLLEQGWPGESWQRTLGLAVALFACAGSLLGHGASYWSELYFPQEMFVAVSLLVFLVWLMALLFLNRYLRHVVGLSLKTALKLLSEANQLGKRRLRHLAMLQRLGMMWWGRLPRWVKGLLLPGACYLVYLWFNHFFDVILFGNNKVALDGVMLRMYSAIWFVISFVAISLFAWCTRHPESQAPGSDASIANDSR